jgi:Kef-type K+ transport system membrane component KefB
MCNNPRKKTNRMPITLKSLKTVACYAGVISWLRAVCETTVAAQVQVEPAGSHGLVPATLAGVAVMLVLAKIGGEIFERFSQPAVLGELVSGIILGNLFLINVFQAESLKTNDTIAALAELGVIILLFEVGLESDLQEMMEVGWSSLLVAILGVVAPFFLGWGLSAYLIPNEPRLVHIYIGATLCATSVGITARVFKDLGKLGTREAKIILGAAVIDDVLGLLILTIVAGAIRANASGSSLVLSDVVLIAAKAVLFLILAIAVGHFVLPRILRGASRLESRGVLLTLAISTCLILSWAATKVELAAIVGAFAAGLVLDEVHYKPKGARTERSLEELLQPVSTLLVPIFFVSMGMKVDLRLFTRLDIIGFAILLTVVAVIGKQICSLGVLERKIDRLTIGLGMIPRGEVGLIFAGIGATLMVPNASGIIEPVINSSTFNAVVIMVLVTTFVTPFALKWSLGRLEKPKPRGTKR